MEVLEAAEVVEAGKVVEARETEKDAALASLVSTQICPSRAAVLVGLVPHSLGEEWCCSHSYSHCSHRRAQLHAEQVEKSSDTSGSAPGSPEMTSDSSPLATSSPRVETVMEEAMMKPQASLLGFVDVAGILQRGQLLQTPPRPIEEQAPPLKW